MQLRSNDLIKSTYQGFYFRYEAPMTYKLNVISLESFMHRRRIMRDLNRMNKQRN